MVKEIISNLINSNSVENLSKVSSIVDVFTITMNDLKEVNSKIQLAQADRMEKVKKLSDEHASLTEVRMKNERVISKIEKLFED